MKHNIVRLMFGNEDRIEETEFLWFNTPQEAAAFFRRIADNIDQFKDSKDYRSSEKSIFDGIDTTENENP